nr:MAG TPA: hypothetical protein [Bacteriophage sp.]
MQPILPHLRGALTFNKLFPFTTLLLFNLH